MPPPECDNGRRLHWPPVPTSFSNHLPSNLAGRFSACEKREILILLITMFRFHLRWPLLFKLVALNLRSVGCESSEWKTQSCTRWVANLKLKTYSLTPNDQQRTIAVKLIETVYLFYPCSPAAAITVDNWFRAISRWPSSPNETLVSDWFLAIFNDLKCFLSEVTVIFTDFRPFQWFSVPFQRFPQDFQLCSLRELPTGPGYRPVLQPSRACFGEINGKRRERNSQVRNYYLRYQENIQLSTIERSGWGRGKMRADRGCAVGVFGLRCERASRFSWISWWCSREKHRNVVLFDK